MPAAAAVAAVDKSAAAAAAAAVPVESARGPPGDALRQAQAAPRAEALLHEEEGTTARANANGAKLAQAQVQARPHAGGGCPTDSGAHASAWAGRPLWVYRWLGLPRLPSLHPQGDCSLVTVA